MTAPKKDGGPAVPCNFHVPCKCGLQLEITGHSEGMTMRQYYKAAALQGILAGAYNVCKQTLADEGDYKRAITRITGIFADLMLAEDEEFEKK